MYVLLIISLLLLIALLTLFNRFAKNRMPSRKNRGRVLQEMKADMDEWSADLVPMHREELDLFSLGQDKQVLKSSKAGATAKGTYTTIFHEPVASYSYRRFLGKKPNEVLYVRTAENEYVYWTENGRTTLEIDGQTVGTLENNRLFGQRTGKELARIEAQVREGSKYLPVSVGDREVGSLTSEAARSDDPLNQRAFEFIPEDLNPKEEQLLVGMAVRELVARGVSKG